VIKNQVGEDYFIMTSLPSRHDNVVFKRWTHIHFHNIDM